MFRPFHDEDPRVLTPEAFEFMLANELKRALRAQNFLTLVTLAASGPAADPVPEVARLIGSELRETDLLGRTADRRLAMVLLDVDREGSMRVIERLLTRIEHHGFRDPVEIAVSAACCPTDATDVAALRHAAARPIATRRTGGEPRPNDPVIS